MSGGLGTSDGVINLRGVIQDGKLVSLLDHTGKDIGAPVTTSNTGAGKVKKLLSATRDALSDMALSSHVSAYCIGDSLTSRGRVFGAISSASGLGMWNWANWLIGAPFVFRANLGISGDTTRSVMTRISNIPKDIQVVFLMTGTNPVLSMASNASQATIDATFTAESGYLAAGIESLISAGKIVIMSTIIPNNAYSASSDSRIQLLDRLNAFIRTLAGESVFVVDGFAALWDSAQPTLRVSKANTMHSDGTHIAAMGAMLIGTAAMEAAKLAYAAANKNYQLYGDFAPTWQLYSGFRSGTGGTAAVKSAGAGNLADGWRSINNAGAATITLDNTALYTVSADYVGPAADAPIGVDDHWQEFAITATANGDNPRLRLPTNTSIGSAGSFPDSVLGGDLFFAEIDVWVSNPVNLSECSLSIQANFAAGASPADQPYIGATYVRAQAGTVSDASSSVYPYSTGFRAIYRTPVLRVPENINTTVAQALDFSFDMLFVGAGSANVKVGRPRIWHKSTGFIA